MEDALFNDVADVVRGLLGPALGEPRCQPRKYGIKVWFGPAEPPKEHYEAQVISRDAVPGAKVLGLEIGFHAEHNDAKANEAVAAALVASEKRWRKALGGEAVVGPFLGKADRWRRASETWPDPDLSDPDLPVEIALRLADYITALEPVRRSEKAPSRKPANSGRARNA